MNKKVTDIGSRFVNALFQSFLACIIVEAILFVVLHFIELYEIDLANIYFWIIAVGFALVAGLIAGLISFIHNKILNRRYKNNAKKKRGGRT